MDEFRFRHHTLHLRSLEGEVCSHATDVREQLARTCPFPGRKIDCNLGSLCCRFAKPRIWTNNAATSKLWLKTADGDKAFLAFEDFPHPVTEMDYVSLTWLRNDNSINSIPVLMVNHSTGERWQPLSTRSICSKLELNCPPMGHVIAEIATIVILLVSGIVFDSAWFYLPAAAIALHRIAREIFFRRQMEEVIDQCIADASEGKGVSSGTS